MTPFVFLVVAMAVARLSVMLVDEDGPYAILEKWRRFLGIRYNQMSERYVEPASGLRHELASLFLCSWCLSIWLGTLATLFLLLSPTIVFWLSLPLALSFVAVVFKEKLS